MARPPIDTILLNQPADLAEVKDKDAVIYRHSIKRVEKHKYILAEPFGLRVRANTRVRGASVTR